MPGIPTAETIKPEKSEELVEGNVIGKIYNKSESPINHLADLIAARFFMWFLYDINNAHKVIRSQFLR
jgi:hypothetical protein